MEGLEAVFGVTGYLWYLDKDNDVGIWIVDWLARRGTSYVG